MAETIDLSDLSEEQVKLVQKFVASLKAEPQPVQQQTEENAPDFEVWPLGVKNSLTRGENAKTVEEGTLADFLSEFIGVLNSSEHIPGGANLSQKSRSKFAEGMFQKRMRGRL
jgi:hypothetical protein